jgi:glycosyltransferase involved in cell wall biosynthesis
MKKIKILYYYSSSQVDTGSPRAMLRMIDSLDRNRFQPAFMASRAGSLIDELRSRKVEIIEGEVASVSWKNPLRLIARVRAKRRILRQFGVDFVHMNEPGWNSDIVLAAGLARIPVALHLHNPGNISKKNFNFAIARRVFLCSAAQSNEIVNFDKIEDKCVVLHNAVDIGLFASGRPIRAAIGLAQDDIVIGTIAQISHRKGIDLFLDTAERLVASGKQLKFVIVGPKAVKEEQYFQSIIDRIKQGPLRESVIYLGSRVDVPDVLASFDVFFLPTRAEPFGMVVIEAMAAGVPVVVSGVGGIVEIVTSRDIGRTVRPLSSEAYAAAIDELLQMGDGRKALGERGRQSLSGRFDLAKMGVTLGAVYEELVTS